MKEYKLNEKEIKWLKENDIFKDLEYVSVEKETNKYCLENEFNIDFWQYEPVFENGRYKPQHIILDEIDIDISESEQIFLGLREVGLYKVIKEQE